MSVPVLPRCPTAWQRFHTDLALTVNTVPAGPDRSALEDARASPKGSTPMQRRGVRIRTVDTAPRHCQGMHRCPRTNDATERCRGGEFATPTWDHGSRYHQSGEEPATKPMMMSEKIKPITLGASALRSVPIREGAGAGRQKTWFGSQARWVRSICRRPAAEADVWKSTVGGWRVRGEGSRRSGRAR
jgi:hypothetical protein